jgi:hypothetical protein
MEFKIEFTIPRDLELAENFEVNNKSRDVKISLRILKRKIKIPGINDQETTAYFVNEGDRFGDNVETRIECIFNFDKNPVPENFKSLHPNEMIKIISHLEDLMLKDALILLNQIIETHQYVNDKYYIFPIELIHIYDFKLSMPFKVGYIKNQFGKGYFTNDYRRLIEVINENSSKVANFINNREKYFEPLKIMKYSIEFSRIGLLRPAITEAQSAVEHLLTKQYFKIKKEDFPKKQLKNNKKKDLNFFEKLEEYSKAQEKFKFANIDKNLLKSAVELRNKIIHGKETPELDKELCQKYVNNYKDLFDSILF